jgi:hypothetical protein
MRSRLGWLALSSVLGLPVWGQATSPVVAFDGRAQFGSPDATALEALVARLFPGATVEWGTRIELRLPTGELRELSVPGFTLRPVGDQYLLATCIDLPGERAQAEQRLVKFQARASREASVRVVAAWVRASGELSDLRITDAPVAGGSPGCRDVQIAEVGAAGTWPKLTLAYWSLFTGDEWWARVDAVAHVDLTTGKSSEVLPQRVTKTWRDGRQALRFVRLTPTGAPAAQRAALPPEAAALVLEHTCRAEPCAVDLRALAAEVGP